MKRLFLIFIEKTMQLIVECFQTPVFILNPCNHFVPAIAEFIHLFDSIFTLK